MLHSDPVPERDGCGRRVHIVMAVWRPDERFFRAQLESILNQSHENFRLYLCLDGPEAGDPPVVLDSRVTVLRNKTRSGVYGNFLFGLRFAVEQGCDTDLYAFSDQDDVWRADKLARQLAAFDDRQVSLCYHDARIIADDGRVQHASLAVHEHRARHRDIVDVLIANDVTGMTMMFRYDVARHAVELGPAAMSGKVLMHDWWTALVALRLGESRYLDEPLVDYRKHDDNVIGPAAGPKERQTTRERKRRWLSRNYLAMCGETYAVRRLLIDRLAGVGATEGIDGWQAGSVMRRMLGAKLRGHSVYARQAYRCLVGALVRTNEKQ